MWSVVVIELLIFLQGFVDRLKCQRANIERIELHPRCAVCVLDTSIVLRPFRRQYVQRDLKVFTRVLKLGHELTATIHLDRDQWERQIVDQILEKTPGLLGLHASMVKRTGLHATQANYLSQDPTHRRRKSRTSII